MLTLKDRKMKRRKIRGRIRMKVQGTADRPRLAIFRSLKHIYAQAIDDASGRTLASASSKNADVKAKAANGGNISAAKQVGEAIGTKLKQAGVEQVVFDRGGFVYHGRIKALAEAAREAGLKF